MLFKKKTGNSIAGIRLIHDRSKILCKFFHRPDYDDEVKIDSNVLSIVAPDQLFSISSFTRNLPVL